MIIVLSGMDGSGKTSVSHKIAEGSLPFLRVSRGSYFLLEPLMSFLRHLKGADDKRSTINPFLLQNNKPRVFKIWPWIVLIDDLLHYWLVLKPKSLFINIVCDRFMYDRLIGFRHYGFISDRSYDIYGKLIPTPSKALILEVDPTIALNRETDEKHPLQFYESLRNLYRRLAEEKGIEIINTNLPFDEELEHIMKKILI